MFDNLKNIGQLMKMAGEAKTKAAEMQAELEKRIVEGEAGAGAVRVTMNGRARVLRIELDQHMLAGLAGDDKTMIEELIAAAVNDANDKVQQIVAEEMKKITGGMDLGGLQNMFGQG
jgi:DNA-binding YbaB/EbfC family protein